MPSSILGRAARAINAGLLREQGHYLPIQAAERIAADVLKAIAYEDGTDETLAVAAAKRCRPADAVMVIEAYDAMLTEALPMGLRSREEKVRHGWDLGSQPAEISLVARTQYPGGHGAPKTKAVKLEPGAFDAALSGLERKAEDIRAQISARYFASIEARLVALKADPEVDFTSVRLEQHPTDPSSREAAKTTLIYRRNGKRVSEDFTIKVSL